MDAFHWTSRVGSFPPVTGVSATVEAPRKWFFRFDHYATMH